MSDKELELFGTGGESTADLLDRYARAEAVERLAKEVKDDVRERLDEQADDIETQTQGAFNVKVPKVGQVYRTAPEPKAVVDDEDKLLTWLDQEAPDLVAEKDRLRVLDEKAAMDLVRGARAGTYTKKELVALIGKALDVTTERSVPADTIFDALESYGLARPTREATYITEHGEIVPGTGVKQAPRRLTVRITEKSLFDDELRAAIPALSARSE